MKQARQNFRNISSRRMDCALSLSMMLALVGGLDLMAKWMI